MSIKTIEDMDFCYYNLTYLLSMGCSGLFCKECIYHIEDGRCIKGNIRKIIDAHTDTKSRTITTQTELFDLMCMVKESCIDTCSLSGCCSPNKCKFYNNTAGECVCDRMTIREMIIDFERKQA